MQLRTTHSQLYSFVAVQILLPNSWWIYHGTNKTELVFAMSSIIFGLHKHKYNEYHCHIYLFVYLIFTPSAYSQHEGAEYKVYLLEIFQTDAFP